MSTLLRLELPALVVASSVVLLASKTESRGAVGDTLAARLTLVYLDY
jgi:hypothetical protein